MKLCSLCRNLQHLCLVCVEIRLDSCTVKALQVEEVLKQTCKRSCLLFLFFLKKAFCGLTEHCSCFLCFFLSFFWA